MTTLSPITYQNWKTVTRLELHPNQERFLPPLIEAIVETQFFSGAKQFLILRDEEAIGYVQMGEEVESGNQKIFRLMIDKKYQGLGLGKASMEKILALQFSDPNCESVVLCYSLDNQEAAKFYGKLGFKEVRRLPCSRNPLGKVEVKLTRTDWLKRL